MHAFYSTSSCFSNFHPAKFIVKGVEFSTSEQYFMKMKQERYDPENKELAEKILKAKDPKKAKALGRNVANFSESDWKDARFGIMKDAVRHKFSQNLRLKQELLATSPKILVEASPSDRIWGVGLTVQQVEQGVEFRGLNLLGKALMDVRAEFSSASLA